MNVYRGDIFFVKKFKESYGSEQDAGRPAVIVSNDIGNKHSSICEVVYLTSQEKNPLPTHVPIMCRVPSTALCEQVTSVFKDRLGEYIRSCTDEEMEAIDRALMVSLGLNPDVTCNEDDNSQIDDLKMKLEGAERALNEEKAKYNKLLSEVNAHKPMLLRSPLEVEEALDLLDSLKTSKPILSMAEGEMEWFTEEKTKLTTERDLYKQLYEQMLERILGKSA